MLRKSVLAALTVTLALHAQPGGGKGKGGGGQPVQPIQLVKPGLYLVEGAGANSEVRVTGEGIILVDGKLPSQKNYDDLMEQIKSVSTQPVKFLLVTHHHQDHTGNDQRFLDAGVTVIGTESLKKNLETYKADPLPAAPSVTFAAEHEVRLGGAVAEMRHLGNAHTSGDSVVYFPDLKVIAVSDIVTVGGGPLIDYSGGGSAAGFLQSLDALQKIDYELAIPGNGKPMTKDQVQTFKSQFETVIAHAKELVRKGVTKEDLMGQLKSDDIPWTLRVASPEAFYDEVSHLK